MLKDALLVILNNRGPISYRFRDKLRFRLKIENVPHVYLTLPPRGFPLDFIIFVTAVGLNNLKSCVIKT